MTQQAQKLTVVLGAAALLALMTVAFLAPQGEPVSYGALNLAAMLGGLSVVAFAYARYAQEQSAPPLRNEQLRPQVDWVVLPRGTDAVPYEIFEGQAPLIALVREGEVPHPELVERLTPYFADPSVAFVQAATRYEGAGRTAGAFRAAAALAAQRQAAAAALGAVELSGGGALVARDALHDAYRPGCSFGELGVRLQALGYTARFEQQELTLAWAPLSIDEYWPIMLARARASLRLAATAALVPGLPFATRMQYLASASVWGAAGVGAAAALLAPLAVLIRGTGPLLISPGALPVLILLVLCLSMAAYAFGRLVGRSPLQPAALALLGMHFAAYRLSYAAATSEPMRRAFVAVRAAALGFMPRLIAIARGGGSGGTAPAGTPARL